MPQVSLIMPYMPNRGLQLDKTLQSIQQQKFTDLEVLLIPDVRPRNQFQWLNPAPLWNEAIRRSTGSVLILQSPECQHISPNVISELSKVPAGEMWLASVLALNPDGTPDKWYCHSEHRCENWAYFCASLNRIDYLQAGGMNEAISGYGGEDVDFANRLEKNGVRFIFRDDLVVHHQWHEFTGGVGV